MNKSTCSMSDCALPAVARTLCSSHYGKAYRSGAMPHRTKALSTDSLDTRLRNIGWTVTASGCWEWDGYRTVDGYGTVQAGKGYSEVASRIAFEAWVRKPRQGNSVCHHCDNPPCINPGHLFEGTHQDNMTDMVSKKRVANGERRLAKITDAQVAEMRATYAAGDTSHRELAVKYGVSAGHVGRVLRGIKRSNETYRRTA